MSGPTSNPIPRQVHGIRSPCRDATNFDGAQWSQCVFCRRGEANLAVRVKSGQIDKRITKIETKSAGIALKIAALNYGKSLVQGCSEILNHCHHINASDRAEFRLASSLAATKTTVPVARLLTKFTKAFDFKKLIQWWLGQKKEQVGKPLLSLIWCLHVKSMKNQNLVPYLDPILWDTQFQAAAFMTPHASISNVTKQTATSWCFFPKAQPKGSFKEPVHRWPPTTDHSKLMFDSWLIADHQPLTTARWCPIADW